MKKPKLAEWLIIAAVLSILALTFVTMSSQAIINHKHVKCASNLNQLSKAMFDYSISGMEPEGSFPSEPLGGHWWLILYEHEEVENARLFSCPVLNRATPGETSYRGPLSDPNMLAADAPVGCCTHTDAGDQPEFPMAWVAKSGDVHTVPVDSPEWVKILSQTKD